MPRQPLHLFDIWNALDLSEDDRVEIARSVIRVLREGLSSDDPHESRQCAALLSEMIGLRKGDQRHVIERPIHVVLPDWGMGAIQSEDESGTRSAETTSPARPEHETGNLFTGREGLA